MNEEEILEMKATIRKQGKQLRKFRRKREGVRRRMLIREQVERMREGVGLGYGTLERSGSEGDDEAVDGKK